MSLVYEERSSLPFYYRKLAGNIPVVKTVKALLSDLDMLGFQKMKLVMDKGFFSVPNINRLMKERLKFKRIQRNRDCSVDHSIESVPDRADSLRLISKFALFFLPEFSF